jgi:hypothetical protein
VYTMLRLARRALPLIPWPDVQPLPSAEPKPTKNAPNTPRANCQRWGCNGGEAVSSCAIPDSQQPSLAVWETQQTPRQSNDNCGEGGYLP